MNKSIIMLFGAFFILSAGVVFGQTRQAGVSTNVEEGKPTLYEGSATQGFSDGSEVGTKPSIVDHFACSDYCPGPQEQYIVRVYKDVTDPEECKKLGGTPSKYYGWIEYNICLAETSTTSEPTTPISEGDPDKPIIIGGIPNIESVERKAEFLKAFSSATSTLSGVYIKFGDIKGESDQMALSVDTSTISTSSGLVSKSGNVEFEWKVEEGESTKKPKEIIVVGSQVRGWDVKTKEEIIGVAPSSPSMVTTDEDLALFVTAGALKTEVVEDVSLNYKKIKISAAVPAKLFGFIPSTIATTLIVERDAANDAYGRVKVQFPWWHVLTTKLVSEKTIQSLYNEEEQRAGSVIATATQNTQGELARQFQTLSNIMKTMHDTAKNAIQNIR